VLLLVEWGWRNLLYGGWITRNEFPQLKELYTSMYPLKHWSSSDVLIQVTSRLCQNQRLLRIGKHQSSSIWTELASAPIADVTGPNQYLLPEVAKSVPQWLPSCFHLNQHSTVHRIKTAGKTWPRTDQDSEQTSENRPMQKWIYALSVWRHWLRYHLVQVYATSRMSDKGHIKPLT